MTFKQLKPPAKSNKKVQEYIQAVERGRDSYFVVKKNDRWQVRKASRNQRGQAFITKAEAISNAKSLAAEKKSQVFVFNTDGRLTKS